MVEHIVLFKVKSGTPDAAVRSMLDGLASLKTRVPGIVQLSAGTNTSDRSKGFTHGLVVRFQNQAGLEQYLPHPAHQEVVQTLIKPIIDELIVVDYEF